MWGPAEPVTSASQAGSSKRSRNQQQAEEARIHAHAIVAQAQKRWRCRDSELYCRELNALINSAADVEGVLVVVDEHLSSFNAVNVSTAIYRIAKVRPS
jgi:Pyruvate/2-oxoacid:ferredoxin oxidoreductase delta subunit